MKNIQTFFVDKTTFLKTCTRSKLHSREHWLLTSERFVLEEKKRSEAEVDSGRDDSTWWCTDSMCCLFIWGSLKSSAHFIAMQVLLQPQASLCRTPDVRIGGLSVLLHQLLALSRSESKTRIVLLQRVNLFSRVNLFGSSWPLRAITFITVQFKTQRRASVHLNSIKLHQSP